MPNPLSHSTVRCTHRSKTPRCYWPPHRTATDKLVIRSTARLRGLTDEELAEIRASLQELKG